MSARAQRTFIPRPSPLPAQGDYCDYANDSVRFEADLHLIRERIRAHDPACWGEYLDLIKFRFFASRLDLREIVNRITGPVDSLIYEAGQADALECLQSLRDAGCPLTSIVDSCDFLIHIAARAGAHRVLVWLIHERIFNIDATTSSGTTALHHAAFGRQQHNVEFLLAHGAFVDSASSNGETPLHAAIRGGELPIIRLLVDAGANLGATTDGGTTPLALAATYELWDCARLLLSRGAPWKYALPELIRHRGTKVLSEPELSNTRLDVCPQDRLGYLFATIAPDEARVLLERGADPGKAAEYALRNTRNRLLRLIKEYGNFPYLEAHYRSAAQSLSGMIQLLDEGGDPNAWVCRPSGKRVPLVFYVATEVERSTEVVSMLLGRGADPTRPRESALAPLLSELLKRGTCSMTVLQQLVWHGEDINAADSDGARALHDLLTPSYFWTEDSQDLLEALLEIGAEVNVQDTNGFTPLMLAVNVCYARALDRSSALLRAGADLHAQDGSGRTVLHHLFESATERSELAQCQEVLDLLLRSGADIFVRDQRGLLPEEAGDATRVPSERLALRRLRERVTWNAGVHPGPIRQPRLDP